MSSKARDSYEDRRHVLDMHPEPPRLTSLYQKKGCQDRYCGKAVACAAGHLVAVQAEADRASFPPSKLLVPETELVEARMLSR